MPFSQYKALKDNLTLKYILHFRNKGLKYKEIAKKLVISEQAVKQAIYRYNQYNDPNTETTTIEYSLYFLLDLLDSDTILKIFLESLTNLEYEDKEKLAKKLLKYADIEEIINTFVKT